MINGQLLVKAPPMSHAVCRWTAFGRVAIAGLFGSHFSTQTTERFSPQAVAAKKPSAQRVQPLDAMRLGREHVAEHPGTEFLAGSGDSMLPRYRDFTAVVTQRVGLANPKAGMTDGLLWRPGLPGCSCPWGEDPRGMNRDGGWQQDVRRNAGDSGEPRGRGKKACEPSGRPLVALVTEARSRNARAFIP